MSSWFLLSVDNICLVVTLKLLGSSDILFVLRTSCLSFELVAVSFLFFGCFSRCWRLLMVKCSRSSSKFSQYPFLFRFFIFAVTVNTYHVNGGSQTECSNDIGREGISSIELLRTNKKTIYKSMLRRSECINQLMKTAVNHLAVRNEISNLDSELDEYSNLCHRIKGLMIDNEAKDHPDEDEILSLEIDQTVFEIKTRALAWLRDCHQRLNVPSSKSRLRRSKSSRSSKSSKHTKASTSSGKSAKEKYVEEAAKIAALKAEAEYISNLASLEYQRKIAKSQAKMEIYERFFEPQDTGMATSVQATSNDLSSYPTKVSTNSITSHPWNLVGSTFTSELNPSAAIFMVEADQQTHQFHLIQLLNRK